VDIKKLLCKGIKTKEEEKEFVSLVGWLFSRIKKENLFFEENMEDDDIKNWIVEILLSKRSYICSRERVSLSLLHTIVRNHLIDTMRTTKEKKKEKISLDEIIEDSGERDNRLEDKSGINPIDLLFIDEVVEFLKRTLTDREKETLCFEVFKVWKETEENPFLSTLSNDAKYQAKSRLIKKIRKFLPKEYVGETSRELAKIFIGKVMSEICEKIVKN